MSWSCARPRCCTTSLAVSLTITCAGPSRRASCWPANRRSRSTLSATIDAICHAIEAHRFRKGPAPATLEAACLHDADKLDAIGAIGVARAVAYSASHGHRLWSQPLDSIDPAQPPPAGIDYTPSHEFVYKLGRLRDRLLTPTARQIAGERHQVMAAFFRQLDAEVSGLA